MAASRHRKKADIAKLLLDRGADISAKTNDGANALIYCADQYAKPILEVMRILIDSGLGVDTTDNGGNTALITAAKASEPEFIEKLIAKGRGIREAATFP